MVPAGDLDVHAEVSTRVEYEPTPLGQSGTVLDAMTQWGDTVHGPPQPSPTTPRRGRPAPC